MWKSLEDALDVNADLSVEIAITDELEPKRAIAALADARASGQTALLLADEALDYLSLGEVELADDELAVFAGATDAPIEAALAKLAAAVAGDPLAVLHRLDTDTLAAIENDEEVEIDPDCYAPDDPRQAYEAGVEAFEHARAHAFGNMFLAEPIRTFDSDSALARLMPGRARLIRIATTPARALLHLGYGAGRAPHIHARVWEAWATTFQAEPLVIQGPSLYGLLGQPVTTRDALVRLAREIAVYDADIIDGWLPFLGTLYRNTSLHFWWD
jgi:hypothetical protein